MSSWQPQWISDADPRPRTVHYYWRHEVTGETLFVVKVSGIGLIHVLEDDWLSKYTAAIYGDLEVHARFIRINRAQKSFDFIRNVDLIYKGETVLHVDSFLAFERWRKEYVAGDSIRELPDEIIDEITAEFDWTVASAGIELAGWILEFVPAALVAATTLAAVGGALTIVGLFVGLYDSAEDIVYVNNPEKFPEQFYAILYATTAWVYDETSDTETFPTTSEDLGELNAYIPRLPYRVPGGVADPRSWLQIHGYADLYLMNLREPALGMTKGSVLAKLGQLKSTWEETSAGTIAAMTSSYNDATRYLTGDPASMLARYKQQLRARILPGAHPVLLSKAEFFEARKRETLRVFHEKWTTGLGEGPSSRLKLVERLERRYTMFYPVPK